MNNFESRHDSEHDRQRDAAISLVRRVNDILIAHPRSINMDIRDIQNSNGADDQPRQNELIRMSAKNHMQCLAAFYKRVHPDATSVKIFDGAHSALPIYDAISSRNAMLLATTLILPEEDSLQAVTVTVRDEYVLNGSTIYMDGDGRFEAYNEIKPRDDKLVAESLELVGIGKRDLIVPILSGVVHPKDLDEYIDALRPIIAEKYDKFESERFLKDIEKRYHEKSQSRAIADELGLSRMSSNEIEDILTILEPADSWT